MGSDPNKLTAPLVQALLLPSILAIGWLYFPYCETGPILCMWRRLLGIHCLGCGLTRAVCFVAHGRFREALAFNPMIVPVFLVLFCISAWGCYSLYRIWLRRRAAARK